MTYDEKKKCAEIWEMFTNKKTKPEDWNGSAADALAVMVAEIKQCTQAMNHVPRPSGSRPGYGWIVNYVYKVLKNRYSSNQPQMYKACIVASINLKQAVEIELQMGN
jgi:hypothetical protein